MATIRWGILGTGNIAAQFAGGLVELPDAQLVGVGSRQLESAQAFAARFGAVHAYGSYGALAQDPEVDVIYIATPHTLHAENSLLCLKMGKAVLCEKPFTLNAAQAQTVIDTARANKLFLMEAMWTRFFPLFKTLRDLVETRIGEPRLLHADFGFASPVTESRIFDPNLGGGALLDVGVYPVSLASYLLGAPTAVSSYAQLGATGVDEQNAIVLNHQSGALALLSSAIRATTPQAAVIMGSEGRIRLCSPWWQPQKLILTNSNGEETFTEPLPHNGYAYEATEVMRCLRAGRLESPLMPLDESLSIMKTLDRCRAQWGLSYPGETLSG